MLLFIKKEQTQLLRNFFALVWKAAVSCSHRSSMMSLASFLISGYSFARF